MNIWLLIITIAIVAASMAVTCFFMFRRKKDDLKEINEIPPDNKKNIIMILAPALLLLLSGCISAKPTLQIGGSSYSAKDAQKKVDELQKKLDETAGDVKLTKEEVEKLKNETLTFMNLKGAVNSLSFRVWATIKTVAKFILKVMWAMVSTWFGDLLWLATLIMLFTWSFSFISKFIPAIAGVWGIVIKALTFWMSFSGKLKIITTFIWAFVLSVIWKLLHSPCDWLYILPMGLLSCILANVVWEYLANKTGVSDKVEKLTHKVLATKLKIKGIVS